MNDRQKKMSLGFKRGLRYLSKNLSPEQLSDFGGDFREILRTVRYNFSDPQLFTRGQIIFFAKGDNSESEKGNSKNDENPNTPAIDREPNQKENVKKKLRKGEIDIEELLNPDPNNYSDLEFDD